LISNDRPLLLSVLLWASSVILTTRTKPEMPVYSSTKTFVVRLCLVFSLVAFLPTGAEADNVQIDFDAGGGTYPFLSNSSGTATNGLEIRFGTFDSVTDADVQALGYNKLWIGNQFTSMTPGAGNTTTSTLSSQAGSFSTDGVVDADWTTSSASALSESIWLVFSDNAAFTSSTEYGVFTSNSSEWVMPAAYSGTTFKLPNTSQITVSAFGSTNGTLSTSSVRSASVPSTYLYWDSNGGAGLGGAGTWSASTSDTEWTTESGGVSGDGPYAWGSTSGTDYYAGAGLTANFAGTAGTVTVSGTVDTREGLRVETDGYTLSSGTIALNGTGSSNNTITVTTGTTAISSALTGSNGLIKEGGGTLRLDSANTGLSGNVTINNGTLTANATNSIALSGSDRTIINSGGSLLITANNSVSGDITLDGGTLSVNGTTTDTVGALTLSSNSIIDLSLGSNPRSVYFADSSGIAWSGSLSIWNWNGTNLYGTSYGSGDRQLFFGNSASGLTQTQLDSISFYSDSGSSFIGTAYIRSTGEIAAVPEPEVYATALLLLVGAVYHFRKQRRLSRAAQPVVA
jgi:autotransporter-associated beta strand protein